MSIENIRVLISSDPQQLEAQQMQSQQMEAQQMQGQQVRVQQMQSQQLKPQQMQGQQLEPQQMQGQQLEPQQMQGQQQRAESERLETQEQRQHLQIQQTQLQTQCHQYIQQANAASSDAGALVPSITPRTSTECYCYLDVMLHCCPDGDLASSGLTTPISPDASGLTSPQFVTGAPVPDTCNVNLRSCCPKIDTVLVECCALEWPNGKWAGSSAFAQDPSLAAWDVALPRDGSQLQMAAVRTEV